MFKQTGNPAVEELTKSYRGRSYNLGRLKAVKKDDGRYCAWCVQGKLHHGNQKYCSTQCSNSAMAWAYPQKEDSLRSLLERQGWKCNLCQYDYEPFLKNIMEGERKKYPATPDTPFGDLPWYYFKRLKSRVPPDKNPEVDHIAPIYKGGQPLDRANLQAICYTCHKGKTGKDLSGPRKKDGVV